ncbi:hypothetical protein BDW22DRAFT_382367 [Trametopsis cervina]|nr:hypothetical protein BDW22DRAFT_382367 [Trametopsis cervina]
MTSRPLRTRAGLAVAVLPAQSQNDAVLRVGDLFTANAPSTKAVRTEHLFLLHSSQGHAPSPYICPPSPRHRTQYRPSRSVSHWAEALIHRASYLNIVVLVKAVVDTVPRTWWKTRIQLCSSTLYGFIDLSNLPAQMSRHSQPSLSSSYIYMYFAALDDMWRA